MVILGSRGSGLPGNTSVQGVSPLMVTALSRGSHQCPRGQSPPGHTDVQGVTVASEDWSPPGHTSVQGVSPLLVAAVCMASSLRNLILFRCAYWASNPLPGLLIPTACMSSPSPESPPVVAQPASGHDAVITGTAETSPFVWLDGGDPKR